MGAIARSSFGCATQCLRSWSSTHCAQANLAATTTPHGAWPEMVAQPHWRALTHSTFARLGAISSPRLSCGLASWASLRISHSFTRAHIKPLERLLTASPASALRPLSKSSKKSSPFSPQLMLPCLQKWIKPGRYLKHAPLSPRASSSLTGPG